MPPLPEVEIRLVIRRDSKIVFDGVTNLGMMARTPEDLVSWLVRDNEFPNGVILLTGTGIVPPDEFTLHSGDEVDIAITGIGILSNRVA
jgi:2-dehydro-3-deoxy-D-arabinonate dehydratase